MYYQAIGRRGCGKKRGLDPAAARKRVYQGAGCGAFGAKKPGRLRSGMEQEASGILELPLSGHIEDAAGSYDNSTDGPESISDVSPFQERHQVRVRELLAFIAVACLIEASYPCSNYCPV